MSYEHNNLSILSFDLGNSLGIAFSKFNRQTQKLNVINTKLISIDQIKRENRVEFDFCTNKCLNTIVFGEIVASLINSYGLIDIFVVEDTYVQLNRIRAYSSLLLYLNKLEEIVAVRFKKQLFKISPNTIKKYLTSTGKATKLDMMNEIYNKPDIRLKKSMINTLSEHEIDSISAAYSFARQFSLSYI